MPHPLRASREALAELWRQGLGGRALLERHTAVVDSYLATCHASSPAAAGMALVALGGYGRRELFPFSDIDLMLLHPHGEEAEVEAAASAIFYPLWDAGLEVGHAVRTPEACLADAEADFFFQVAMLDARLVAGSAELFTQLLASFRSTFIEGRRHDFLRGMALHREKRHRQYGQQSYLLEPHIKESRGGLRDIQALMWTAQVVFGLKSLTDLREAGILSESEEKGFAAAWEYLIRVRNRLHYLSGRKNDQLYFEYQDELAREFQCKNGQGLLAVEHFMRQVYSQMRTVAVSADLFFEHVDEVLSHPPSRPGTLARREKPLETGIELQGGRLHFSESGLLPKRPQLLMRIFVQAARTGLAIHHRSRKTIQAQLGLVNDRFRSSRAIGKSFLAILQQAREPAAVLETMLETGLLGAYLPEFARLAALAQHDIYHIYTVDHHLLQTVAALHLLKEEHHALFISLASPQVLFLAGLLHDLGKGSGQDHAIYGAQLAGPLGSRIGLSEGEQACLSFLVRHHLFLTETALRRDLDDENLIRRCAELVGDPDRLVMLYLLAIADAKATGPTLWNDWKAALLLDLFLKIGLFLERDEPHLPGQDRGEGWMREQVAKLLPSKHDFDIASLPDDYLLTFSPEAVTNHIKLRAELRQRKFILRPSNHTGYWSLLLLAKDKPGLLTKICGVLALHNLNILAAQIFTWPDGTVVDLLDLNSTLDASYDEQDWAALERDLGLAFASRLGLAHRLGRKLTPVGQKNAHPGPDKPPLVVIANDVSATYTVIEVHATGRLAIIYDIARTLADFGINIHRARISAQAQQVVDVFYVLDHDGHKIADCAFQEELRQGLLFAAGQV